MSLIKKQVLTIMNKLILPENIIDIIKDYLFHEMKKIPSNDLRYNLLLTIPNKIYDPEDGCCDVDLWITNEKWIYLLYTNYTIQIQILTFNPDINLMTRIDGFIIKL